MAYAFSKSWLFAIGSIGLLLPLAIWGAVHYAQAGHVADSVVLAIVSLPLLLLDIWVWRRLLTNHPALIFLPDALIEQASLFGAGRLERSEIAGVRVGTAGYWRLVYLDLHHRAGRWTTPAIPAVLLGLSADALADEIGRWLKSGPRH